MKISKLLGATVITSGLLLVACHTVHGIGEDVEAGGHAISHGSTRTHQHLKSVTKKGHHSRGYVHKHSHGHSYYYKNGKRVYVRHSHPHSHGK